MTARSSVGSRAGCRSFSGSSGSSTSAWTGERPNYVHRISPKTGAINVEIPLLEAEAVLEEGVCR